MSDDFLVDEGEGDFDDERDPRYAGGDRVVYRGEGGVVDGSDWDRDRYFLTMDEGSEIRADREEVDGSGW